MDVLTEISIAKSVVDRLKALEKVQSGTLYGLIHQRVHYIFGVFSNDDDSTDWQFPAGLNRYGAFQIGPIDQEVIDKNMASIDVTDNPILITVPDGNELIAQISINNELQPMTITIISDGELYNDFIHLRLQSFMEFTSEVDAESVNEELITLRKQISDGNLAFHCNQFNVFLLSENSIVGPEMVSESIGFGKIMDKSSKLMVHESNQSPEDEYDFIVQSWRVMKRATVAEDDHFNEHAPIIQIKQNHAKLCRINFKIDGLSIVHKTVPLREIYGILVESLSRSLHLISSFIMETLTANKNSFPVGFQPEILHFFPAKCGHFVTRILSRHCVDEESARMNLHKSLLLPRRQPMFHRAMAHKFKAGDRIELVQLMNPHRSIQQQAADGEVALVKGNYLYYHYKQDGMDDDGWGCAYRSLQTLASWLSLQGYSDQQVPTFQQIQQCLYDIGDKPHSFVGSKQWIGSTEVNFVLESLLGVTCKIIFVASGAELVSKGPDLLYHFQKYGSPIMIGGGVLAHTILGVDYNRDTGDCKFLILDPHYTGADNIRTILSKGWCGWKKMNFWNQNAYYNMCLPIIPQRV